MDEWQTYAKGILFGLGFYLGVKTIKTVYEDIWSTIGFKGVRIKVTSYKYNGPYYFTIYIQDDKPEKLCETINADPIEFIKLYGYGYKDPHIEREDIAMRSRQDRHFTGADSDYKITEIKVYGKD